MHRPPYTRTWNKDSNGIHKERHVCFICITSSLYMNLKQSSSSPAIHHVARIVLLGHVSTVLPFPTFASTPRGCGAHLPFVHDHTATCCSWWTDAQQMMVHSSQVLYPLSCLRWGNLLKLTRPLQSYRYRCLQVQWFDNHKHYFWHNGR